LQRKKNLSFFNIKVTNSGDFSTVDLEQLYLLMDLEVSDLDPEEKVIVIASINDIK